LIVPLDHSVSSGPIASGANLDTLVGAITANGADAVVLHKGTASHIHPRRFLSAGLIVHNESHFALRVLTPDSAKLGKLRAIVLSRLKMRADGGGYNPYDDMDNGGRSVLYFASHNGRRLEITCAGDFREVVAMQRHGGPDGNTTCLSSPPSPAPACGSSS
jgi:hypothetical protein